MAVTELHPASCDLDRIIASQEKAIKRLWKLTTSSVAVGLTLATWSR
jgi:hypothetical protein